MFGRAVPDFVPSPEAQQRALHSFGDLAEAIGRLAPGDDYFERAYHVFATVHGYVMLELAGMGPPTREDSDQLYERAITATREHVVTRWIALLRGVNVGGGNKIAMPALRVSCEGCGFERVSTYIQSGNVVFEAKGDEVAVDRLAAQGA